MKTIDFFNRLFGNGAKGMLVCVLCAASLTPAVTSCKQDDPKEPGMMTVSKENVVVFGDVEEGEDLVADTLQVTSNRAWSAAFAETVDWVAIDTLRSQAGDGTSKVQSLVFSFKDNQTSSAREASVVITSEDLEVAPVTVKVRQEPAKARIVVIPATDADAISYEGGSLTLQVTSNKDWTVALGEEAPEGAVLDTGSGSKKGNVVLTMVENVDAEKAKTGTVVFTCEGCEPVVVPFSQLPAPAVFTLTSAAEVQALDGIENSKITFTTNVSWTAELTVSGMKNYDDSKVGFSNIFAEEPAAQRKTLEGKKSATTLTVYYPGNSDFDGESTITVKITPLRLDPVIVTIKQKPAIRMCFGDRSANMTTAGAKFGLGETYWPLTDMRYQGKSIYNTDLAGGKAGYAAVPTSGSSAIAKAIECELVLKSGFAIKAYSTSGFFKNTTQGFRGLGTAGDYLEMPVISGKALSSIVYIHRGTGKSVFSIQSADGKEIKQVTFEGQGSQYTIDLPGTEAGKAYRMVAVSGGMSMCDLILYYK